MNAETERQEPDSIFKKHVSMHKDRECARSVVTTGALLYMVTNMAEEKILHYL